MASLIRLPNANFSNLGNAGVVPTILSYDDLEGAYWLASGTEEQRLRNHAGESKPPLLKVNSPVMTTAGETIVGGGAGFDTQLTETASYTYLGVFARADVTTAPTTAQQFTFLGNYNDDPASNDYSGRLYFLDSGPASNNVATWRAGYHYNANGTFTPVALNPSSNSNASPYARVFGNGTIYHFCALTVNASTQTAAFYMPKVQEAPALTQTYTAPNTLSTRRLVKDDGTTPIPVLIGLFDDSFNPSMALGAGAFGMVYSRVLTDAEITAQYAATKAQMQALFPSNIRFSDL